MTGEPKDIAVQIKDELERRRCKLVLAESCTSGLVAATLGGVPGISDWFCGSAVTYREATKTEWLGVSEKVMDEHNVVSKEVAEAMAVGVLKITPEASISAAVTGHLGPTDDTERDGLIHIAIARRKNDSRTEVIDHHAIHLKSYETDQRLSRQREAAGHVLSMLLSTLSA